MYICLQTYPEAYQVMSKNKFAGNFLGLVARPTELDRDLKTAVERGWEKAHKQSKEGESEASNSANPKAHINAQLIPFVHTTQDESGEAFLYFLKIGRASCRERV